LLHAGDQVDGCEVAHVSVRGGERGVPELLLDDRDGLTFHHQFVGVGVTQAVRVDALLNVSLLREARHECSQVGGFERFALEGAEERCVSVDPKGVSGLDPSAQDRHRSRIKANDAPAVVGGSTRTTDANRAPVVGAVVGATPGLVMNLVQTRLAFPIILVGALVGWFIGTRIGHKPPGVSTT
jgi:hypothetical protein